MRDYRSVGIVAARRSLKGPWASHTFVPTAVLPDAPELAIGTPLGRQGEDDTFYAGAAELSIHAQATGHYRDNLTAAQPSVWVVLRPHDEEVELLAATVDPYEGEALAESVGDVVEAVPMPPAVQVWLAAFYDAFHVERAFIKRQRDRADPEALGRRGLVPREEDD
jgi:hypothetical protein